MKNLKLFFVVFLSMVIFAVVGCGGSSNRIVSQNQDNQEIIDDYDEFELAISGDVPAKANDDPEILRILDKIFALDENGVPEIFNYAPLPENYDNTNSSNGTPINFSAYVFSSDLNNNGEFVKTFDLEKDNDYIIKYSHAGRTLDGSYLNFRITAPENQVMILDLVGIGKSSTDEELELQGVISKSIYVPTNHEVIPEEAPCIMLYSFKAPVTGRYEFAISEANLFNFISNDIISEDIISDDIIDLLDYEFPFEFRLYTPSKAHSALDDEEIELSPREILELQRILLEFAVAFDEDGLPIIFDEDEYYEDSYEYFDGVRTSDKKTNKYRDAAYGVVNRANDNSDKILLAPRIDNVPYDPTYTPGAGFYAHSGLRSIQLSALYDDVFSDNAMDDFTIDKPQGDYSIKTSLKTDYISTEDEFLRLSGFNNLGDFTLLKDALSNKMRKSAQLGLAGSKTLSLHYEHYESAPRMPDMGDLKIRRAAVKQLENSFDTFRREHGDYFVAGYTFGLFYDALIEIKAEPYNCYYVTPDGKKKYYDAEEIANYIGNYIKDAFNSPDKTSELIADLEKSLDPKGFVISTPPNPPYDLSVNDPNSPFYWDNPGSPYYWWYHERAQSRNVSVSIPHVQQSGVMGTSAVSSLSGLAKDFDEFKRKAEQTPSSQFERLYVTLIRYREIRRVQKLIPEELPISTEHYKLIKNLNKTIYLARCYKSAVDSIPAGHLINGEAKRQEWANEFSEALNLYTNQLNKLCSDINFVRDYYNKFSQLLEKYKGINHRYVFYRYFLARQKGVSNGCGDWKNSDDEWSYPHFRIGFNQNDVANNKFVKEDLAEGNRYKGSGGFYVNADKWTSLSDSEKEPSGTFPADTRVYYYEGGPIDTNKSEATDLRGHIFGKKSFHWKFDRGGFRRVEIRLYCKLVFMPDSKYPFTGLED